MPWLAVVHTPEEDAAYFRDRVLPSCAVLVAVSGDAFAGFAARRADWIDHLYIDPPFWLRGAGSALIGAVKEGQPRLHLRTFQRNSMARRFYERHGFRAAEFTDGASNEEREPDVRYLWEAVA